MTLLFAVLMVRFLQLRFDIILSPFQISSYTQLLSNLLDNWQFEER